MTAPDLPALLRCPVDLAELRDEGDALVCTACARRYPVVDGIPDLVPPDAEAYAAAAKARGWEEA
jgi:uncharacterized protein